MQLSAFGVGSFVGFVVISCAVACSTSSTGSGTNNGNKGGIAGLFGGGSSNGGTSNGGTSSSSGGSVLPTSCSAVAGEDVCLACLKKSCCDSTLGCTNNTECSAIITCATSCNPEDSACNENCVRSHPNGQASIKALIDCEQASCVAACEGGDDGSSSSSSSSGGTDTCLKNTPQDTSLCPNLPGRQTVKDCPDGPPNAQCVASPANLSGIYCCP